MSARKSRQSPNPQPGKTPKPRQLPETSPESRQFFYTAFHSSPTAIVLSRLSDGCFVEANESFLTLTGYALDEVIGLTSTEAGITSDPKVREEKLAALQQEGQLPAFEIDIVQKSGQVRNGLAKVAMIEIKGEQFALSTFIDITERKRAQQQLAQMKRLYATLSQMNQVIMRVRDRDDLFQSICDVAVQFGEFSLAWVGLLDDVSGDVEHVASSALDVRQWPVKKINIHEGDFKNGPTATALRTSRVVTSEDLQTDAGAQSIRDKLREFAYHSSASVPFRLRGKTIGSLSLISREVGLFKAEEEVHLLEEMGLDISFALDTIATEAEHKQAEEQVRTQTERLKILADASEAFATSIQDYQTLLDQVVRLVSENFSDQCLIRLLSDDQQWFHLAAAYDADPEGFEAIRPILAQTPVRAEDAAPRALRSGQPVLMPSITREQLRASAPPKFWPAFDRFPTYSVIIAHMRVQGSTMGVMNLLRFDPKWPDFNEDDLKLAQTLADRAALAISNARLFEQAQNELAERKRVEAQLRESEELFAKAFYQSPIGIALTDLSDLTIRDINDAMLEMLGLKREQAIGQNALQLNIHIDPEIRAVIGQELRETGKFRDQEVSIRTPDGEIRHLLDSGATVLIGGKPHNLGLFQDITERKQAEQKIQNQLQHLNALREIDTVISSSFNLNLSLDAIVSRAIEELGVDAADVLIYDNVSHTLAYQVGLGFRTQAFQSIKLRIGEGIVGRCVRERKPFHIHDLRQHADEFVRKPLLVDEKFISYHCIPLINKGEVKGVLEVFHRSDLEANQEWIDFLRTLAGHAAIAIESATLFDSLQRSNLELGLAYDKTIEGWSRALDLRDKETGGHTQRVAELVVKLARVFGFGSAELLQIRRGALLHDIGKLGVPDEILFKLGGLSDDDWAKMRKHPQFAYELIAPIQYLRPALDIPYCHHEKWDGSGYPRGLKGEQIPLAARLFAVVDVWDALRHDRPYRAGWPQEKVFEYIRSQVGTHFDPQCVELFFQVMGENAPGPKWEAE